MYLHYGDKRMIILPFFLMDQLLILLFNCPRLLGRTNYNIDRTGKVFNHDSNENIVDALINWDGRNKAELIFSDTYYYLANYS